MAEALVSLALNKLLPLCVEEAHLLTGIHKDFNDIKYELQSIEAFLTDADRRGNNDERDKRWVNEVIQVAFRIEDIIDDYMIFMMNQQPRRLGCVASLYKFVGVVKTSKTRHQIASDIKDVKLNVRDIRERRDRYDGLQFQQRSNNSIPQQNENWRMASLYMDEAEVIGFEAPKSKLIGWLVEGRVERTVVSVVGMGGQGKTTLAKKVFDSKEVVGHFDCCAWITVSESYSVEGLLRDILSKLYKQTGESLPHDIAQMNRGSLIDLVRNCLEKKRYVIVFDDVWNVHFWDEIEFAVIDRNNGSRIFITTRKSEVANYCRSFVEVHELQPLTDEQSWELFNRKVFRFDYDGCCPNELIDISHQILKQCEGLPLAIVVIGGLLSWKDKNIVEWDNFNKNLSSELNNENDSHLIGITRILGLSYDDLPYYLKPFLLYFGIYPEDYQINSERLIRQWIAEGFVKEKRGKTLTLEEVAERCLTELISRSLVQVSCVGIDGKAETCRVHDLIRVMVREKFEELCFCKDISEDGQSGFRRLSVGTTSIDLTCDESPHVRSLLVFTNGSELPNDFVSIIPTKYKRLKVLDFGDAMWVNVPKNLGSLIHLKYLRLKGISEVPKSIGLLQNLETLDVMGTNKVIIPEEISKLRKLRHLLGYKLKLIRLKNSIGGLKSLQTLIYVKLGKGGDEELELIRNMGKLMLLKEFRLSGVGKKHEGVLCSSISNMQHLEKLSIETITLPIEIITLSTFIDSSKGIDLNLISFSPKLQNISLFGKLTRLPEGIPKLQNVIELELSYSHLTDDPVKSLKDMPNLLSLNLHRNAYEGESLHFQEGGFQKLKELSIKSLDNLNSIVIEKGALPSLKKLELFNIPNLQTVPSGIQYLEKLQVLNIEDMPIKFGERISPDGGEDHCLVQHIPHVQTSRLY